MAYDSIKEPLWHGQRVFIIGGGASLKGFDFDCIRNLGIRLGVNDSAFRTECDALFSLDKNWVQNRKNEIANFKGHKAVAVPEHFNFKEHYIPSCLFLRFERLTGLSTKRDAIYGHNSGYGALNYAYLMGASEIYLLGFDMQEEKGNNHWHGGYIWTLASNVRCFPQWAKFFEKAAKQLKESDVRVYNCNPESAITYFEWWPYERLPNLPRI